MDIVFSQGGIALIQYSTQCVFSVCAGSPGTQVIEEFLTPSEFPLGQMPELATVELGNTIIQ